MSPLSLTEQIITIALCSIGTVLTRFLPFIVFSGKKPVPKYINYLGKALPLAVFGMLVVYCLKDVDFTAGSHGLPELISIIVTALAHIWKRNMIFSVIAGTLCYMLLTQVLF